MKNLNNSADYSNLVNRVKLLSETNIRRWGKMTVQQMLMHCITQLQLALGEVRANEQGLFLMRTALGKWIALGVIPWPKGSSTPNEMNVEKNSFSYTSIENEKNELLRYLEKVKQAEVLMPHPFFGTLTKNEWGRLVYKHLDHHLKQFSQ